MFLRFTWSYEGMHQKAVPPKCDSRSESQILFVGFKNSKMHLVPQNDSTTRSSLIIQFYRQNKNKKCWHVVGAAGSVGMLLPRWWIGARLTKHALMQLEMVSFVHIMLAYVRTCHDMIKEHRRLKTTICVFVCRFQNWNGSAAQSRNTLLQCCKTPALFSQFWVMLELLFSFQFTSSVISRASSVFCCQGPVLTTCDA